jgi:diguanylate cyclase (GGDEF)-like protein
MMTAQVLDRQAFLDGLDDWSSTTPLTVALTDIDGFAELNDRDGHDVGDQAIAVVQRALKGSLPKGTYLARMGGDEFACALPGATPEEALIVLEEIRQHLATRRHEFGGELRAISVSIGIAAFPQHVNAVSELHIAADEAMHRAKREGAGRVAIYVEDRMTLKSNYYPKAQLARLAKAADRLGRTEASLLREALGDVLGKYRDEF